MAIADAVVDGFRLGLKVLGNEGVEQIIEFVEKSTEKVGEFSANSQKAFTGFLKSLGVELPNLEGFAKGLEQLKEGVIEFGVTIAIEAGVIALGSKLVDLTKESFETVKQFQLLKLEFTAVGGSAEEGAKGLEYAKNQAHQLGIDLQSAQKAYANLSSVTKGTELQGTQTQNIFSSFAKISAQRGLSTEQQSQVFQDLSTIIERGTITNRELRGGLGNAPALNFKQTLARTLGVSIPQLDKEAKSGELQAADILPKLAAEYQAEAATVSGSNRTIEQSLAAVSNAWTEFYRSFSPIIEAITPAFNLLASAVETLTNAMPTLINAFITLGVTALFKAIEPLLEIATNAKLLSKLMEVLSGGVEFFETVLETIIPVLQTYALTFLAVAAAGKALGAVYDVFADKFPELSKDIANLTTANQALAQSYIDAANAANKNQIKPDLPSSEKDVKTDQSLELFGIKTGINLEPVRQFLGLKTLGEKQSEDFQTGVGDVIGQVYKTLKDEGLNKAKVNEINQIDQQLQKVRSSRFDIAPGDRKAFDDSVALEGKLLKQRDNLEKSTSQFATNLDAEKGALEREIKALDDLAARKGIKDKDYETTHQALENALADVNKTKDTFGDLLSQISKNVGALELALRNLQETTVALNEKIELSITKAKTATLQNAYQSGEGTQITGLKTEQLNTSEARQKLDVLREELAQTEKYLASPQFAGIVSNLKAQAKQMGLTLESTGTLDRMIQQGRDDQDKAVLNTLKTQLEIRKAIAAGEEQAAQSQINLRNTVFDLSKSLSDYFFQMGQKLKEAQLELEKQLDSLKYSKLKEILSGAILPGSSFIDSIISSAQNLLDQVAQISQKILGQKGAKLQFEGQERSMNEELLNFARTLGGASDAVDKFAQSLGFATIAPKKQSANVQSTIDSNLHTVIASFYGGPGEHDAEKPTASGAKFDPNGMTAAAPYIPGTNKTSIPFGTYLLVTDTETGKKVIVKVTDTGDFARLGRGLDLSWGAAGALGIRNKGLAKITYQVVNASGKPLGNTVPSQTTTAQSPQEENGLDSLGDNRFNPSINSNSPDVQQAKQATSNLIGVQKQILDVGGQSLQQDISKLKQDLLRDTQQFQRQIEDQLRTTTQTVRDAENSFREQQSQYLPVTQSSELENNLSKTRNTFANYTNQIFTQKQGFEDTIKKIDSTVKALSEIITQLNSQGNAASLALAKNYQDKVQGLSAQRQSYVNFLETITGIQTQIDATEQIAENFIKQQQKIKDIQEDIKNINQEIAVQNEIKALTDTKELQDLAIRKQLEIDIFEISQRYSNDPKERDYRIGVVRQKANLDLRKVDFDYQNKVLGYQKPQIELGNQVQEAQASRLETQGFTFDANAIKKQNAINNQNFAYKEQVQQLQETYADDPQTLAYMLDQASQLNNLKLDAINQQFKDLGLTIEDISKNAFGTFLDDTLSGTTKVLNALKQMGMSIFKSISQIFSKQASAGLFQLLGLNGNQSIQNSQQSSNPLGNIASAIPGFIQPASSIFGGGGFDFGLGAAGTLGSSASNGLGGLFGDLGSFTGDSLPLPFWKGGKVPNFALGSPIVQAFNKERIESGGRIPYLAVLNKDEHVLPANGEAQRYRSLESRFGPNPLKNFADGGLVTPDSLLDGLATPKSLKLDLDSGRGETTNNSSNITLHNNYYAPTDRFRRQEATLAKEQIDMLKRNFK